MKNDRLDILMVLVRKPVAKICLSKGHRLSGSEKLSSHIFASSGLRTCIWLCNVYIMKPGPEIIYSVEHEVLNAHKYKTIKKFVF